MRGAPVWIGASLIAVSLALAATLGRPASRVITLPLQRLHVSPTNDSLQRHVDSLLGALDAQIALLGGRLPSAYPLPIGHPMLVAVVPDSVVLGSGLRTFRRQLLESLPRAARLAAEVQFDFCVRPSAGLQLIGPRGVPLRGGNVGAHELGYVLAAPGFPAVHVGAPVPDSVLADFLARYAVLIGAAPPRPQRS